jgi:DNA-binding PucR family transcriptional regulator
VVAGERALDSDALGSDRQDGRRHTGGEQPHGKREPADERKPDGPLGASVRAIERSAGALATASVARMDEVLGWFRGLPADQRSWIMLMAQAGIRSFVAWLRQSGNNGPHELSDEIFDAAPRTLARSISLQQAVALIKVCIDVVEEQVPRLAAPGEGQALGDAVLRFSREVAFSAARAYARAAESRGTWDARLQASLVDALLRGDALDELASRAAALGWDDRSPVAVAVGSSPGGEAAAVLHTVHRLGRRLGADVLSGVHGSRLVILLGGAADPLAATGKLLAAFGDGPVVVGPAVPTLDDATGSARAALAGFRAAPAWPTAPRPVPAVELLPERALAGDAEARRVLRQEIYGALARASGGELLETLDGFFAAGGVLESTARALYVHPNTVRYRLRRVGEITGLNPFISRDSFTLRIALTVGRLDPSASTHHT